MKTKCHLSPGLTNLWTSRSLLLVGCFKNSSKCFSSILCQCFYKTLYNNKWCLIGKNVWQIENDVERGFVTGVNTGHTTFKYLKCFVSNEVRNRMYPTFSTCVIRRFLYLDTPGLIQTRLCWHPRSRPSMLPFSPISKAS